MVNQLVQSTFFVRLLENIVPALSWIIISLPFWLSPSHPALTSYFIISFDLYFFYKALSTAYFTTLSYRKIHENETIDFAKKIAKNKKAAGMHHVIIIPNYKEPLYKIEETITSITNTTYPLKNMYLVLAFEKREEKAEEKATKLQKKFSGFFKDIFVSYHILLPHEVPGKASNQTYAAKIVDAYFKEKNISRKDILITICDADSRLSKNYFSYLTRKYLQDAGRQYHFYWAPVLLYNNFWQLPLFVRMQATLSSILRLSFLSQKENLIQVSTYSTSLWLLKSVNFWDVDIIPEDWHIYFQAFFTHGEKVRTIPLYTITNGDAVYSGGLVKTLMNRYEQEKRWAWGVSDVGYVLKKLLRNTFILAYIFFYSGFERFNSSSGQSCIQANSAWIFTPSTFRNYFDTCFNHASFVYLS